ncbi:universal stress protein [Streptomyces hygroscopicus subsp. sporocinereus]|uniref:Universal stress protein n=2 Tax=Streptomyces hygroscopicus TaxID=1912 RepID=A0ABQ3UFC9_STRHY|nr:universal stress protein [Streptomyces sp. NBRC 109436]GHJ33863.1 universal stress protein [Streptomyces hygroscopicus]
MNLNGAEHPLPTLLRTEVHVMPRPVVVGLDGSPESFTAANWAAREARRRALPLSLVHASLRQTGDLPVPDGEDTVGHWARRILRDAEKELRDRYPELPLTAEQVPTAAATALLERAEGARMLVLGSRGLSGLAGFLLGSVGQQVLARTTCPVVMVRANERSATERAGDEVVVALQHLTEAPGPLLDFAFAAASARGAALRAVHVRKLPSSDYGYGLAAGPVGALDGDLEGQVSRELDNALEPWREKYPQVRVERTIDLAFVAGAVLRATAGAGLLVVGRRTHRSALGAHIGPVTHAVLHHSTVPVAVVPHV